MTLIRFVGKPSQFKIMEWFPIVTHFRRQKRNRKMAVSVLTNPSCMGLCESKEALCNVLEISNVKPRLAQSHTEGDSAKSSQDVQWPSQTRANIY